ncbi:MAG: nucleotidyltransferase family protein [Burkholderiales bacterium]|nr:nucleotidyltransferase family protein [Burkholderiales bacterium]
MLTQPHRCVDWTSAQWDLAIRTARLVKLLGTAYQRMRDTHLLDAIPLAVQQQLESSYRISIHRAGMVRIELDAVRHALADYDGPIVLLKGAAYSLQGLAAGQGRIFEDTDLLIPKSRLDDVEEQLVVAGWETETPDPYDQRYYREWSHELPPMRAPGHAMQLDVHHTIIPVTARFRPDAARLVSMSRPIDGTRFVALHPAHQLLHAVAHVFADSDCVSRLRDMVDMDALARQHATIEPDFWNNVLDEARLATLERPLWYALDVCAGWLETPLPPSVQTWRVEHSPPAPIRWLMRSLLGQCMPPPSPDRSDSIGRRISAKLLMLRYIWLRMPPRLLAYHATKKVVRALRNRFTARADTAA